MQKIRLELSHLSPSSIDCLSRALLTLAESLPEPVLFELSADSAPHTPIPVLVAPGNYLPTQTLLLPPDDIICITTDRHYLNIRCTGCTLRARMRFQDIQELLPTDLFLSPCRGILLNRSYINHIQGTDLILQDGSQYPISRRLRRQIQNQLRFRPKHAE